MKATCEKCRSEFEIPEHAIDMAFAKYCKPCIKKGLKRYANLSPKQVIELHAKQMFK